MLKSRKEIQDFIKTIFSSGEIEINGVTASRDDLVRLCENISNGSENVQAFKQYTHLGQIKKICITTF